MITIFNRRELINTFSLPKQSEIRDILSNNKIEYIVRTVNRRSLSPFLPGTRGITGSFGEKAELMYEYVIYVKKQDYEQACRLIHSADTK